MDGRYFRGMFVLYSQERMAAWIREWLCGEMSGECSMQYNTLPRMLYICAIARQKDRLRALRDEKLAC
jgi:hypothetical protein